MVCIANILKMKPALLMEANSHTVSEGEKKQVNEYVGANGVEHFLLIYQTGLQFVCS